MTDEVFVKEIKKLYKLSQRSKYVSEKIRRGRIHSVSNKAEDLFAKYVSNLLPNNTILVDYPLSYKNKEKTHILYPDIAIIENKKIKKIIDIKMDIGWKRNEIADFALNKEKFIIQLRGGVISNKIDNVSITFSKSLKYFLVLISGSNVSGKKSEEIFNNIRNINKNLLELFILTDGVHPGEYDLEKLKMLKIRKDDFKRFKIEIKK